jgi:hypothetical protein
MRPEDENDCAGEDRQQFNWPTKQVHVAEQVTISPGLPSQQEHRPSLPIFLWRAVLQKQRGENGQKHFGNCIYKYVYTIDQGVRINSKLKMLLQGSYLLMADSRESNSKTKIQLRTKLFRKMVKCIGLL